MYCLLLSFCFENKNDRYGIQHITCHLQSAKPKKRKSMQSENSTKHKRSIPFKIAKITGIVFLSILALIVIILILIQTSPVQNFARGKIVSFLENKLKTEVQIKRLDIDFPKMLVLEGVYIEDKTNDTLLAGNQLKVDIDMLKLLSSELQINEINLNGITVKVKRQLPDTVFNYQFIVDAFATPADTTTVADTSAPMKMAIDKIIVDKTRLVFFDVVTGNDVDVYLNHFDTRIATFDPANLRYDVPSIVLNGVRGNIKQTRPLEVTVVKEDPVPASTTDEPAFIQFSNKDLLLSNIDIAYSNEVTAMATRIAFDELNVHPKMFDLKNSVVAIEEIELNELDGYFKMQSVTDSEVVKLTDDKKAEVPAEELPWKVTVDAIRLNNNKFVFDDNTQPRAARGMDFAHLKFTDLTLHADDFLFHHDTIAADIVKGSLQEQSGFVLNQFEADVFYNDKGATLENILIKTPRSEIKRSLVVRYPSLAAVQQNMNLLQLDVDIDNSYLHVKDILAFAPDLASQPAFNSASSRVFVNARLKGSMKRLLIDQFQLRGLNQTNIDVSGLVNNAMDPDNVSADLNIRRFSTGRSDIMALVPPGTLPNGVSLPDKLSMTGKIRGGMKRLEINNFSFRDSRNTMIDLSGTVVNAANPDKVNGNINIRRFYTTRAEIMALAPAGTIPANITIPNTMSLTGRISGSMQRAIADLNLQSSLGNASIKGTVANATNAATATYNATIATTALNLGALMQQPENFGAVSASFTVDGQGYDPEKTNATVKGLVSSAEVMKYNYKNFEFDAAMANQKFTANASIVDPNIHLALHASGDIAGSAPAFSITANIDSIKTQPLNLTPDPIIYRGNIVASVPAFNMDALNGDLFVTNSVLVMNGERILLDTLAARASYAGNEQTIAIQSGFANLVMKGQYKLEQLGTVFMEAIQPYYTIAKPGSLPAVDPYNFTITGNVVDHPALHAFVPNLKRFDGLSIKSRFASGEGWNANVSVPYVLMGTNAIDNVSLTADAGPQALQITTSINSVKIGEGLALYQTGVNATIANNTVDFGLSIKDQNQQSKYRLAGLFAQESDDVLRVSLKPDSLMLNYEKWSISPDNTIRISPELIYANNFNLNQGNQSLILNSVSNTPNSPMEVRFNNFYISTLTSIIQTDSSLVNGMINGNVELRNLLQEPVFVADLNINDLSLKNDTIGNVGVKVNNNTPDVYAANVTITGNGNDVALNGNYYMKPVNGNDFNFDLDIRKLPFETIEAASMGAVRDAEGNLSGNFSIAGTASAPNVDGRLNFNNAGFFLTMLGSYFTIDKEAIVVNDRGIRLNTFTIRDSANNRLVIDGTAGTNNFVNYDLDLTVRADDFRAINTTKAQNDLYYGQLYFNTNLHIGGTETSPVVDGSLRVNEKTNLTMVLPQTEPGLIDREGVIKFVDMDAPFNDTLFQQTLARYDSTMNYSAITGFDIAVNIEVVREAIFNVVIDEANGDLLNLRGEALLTGGIDPSGKITMTGTYEIEEGSYELSFNFLRRRFEIKQGSMITWTGEPTEAQLDVTAIYVANTSPIDLVVNQISDPGLRGYYQQKLPFQVELTMEGELMQPNLSFNIVLPQETSIPLSNEVLSTVRTRLEQIRTEPSELNKQVFALLLLNRFVSENPFESSGEGGGFNAASFAKQSVSKILTEQLNRLAGDLIAGVDINFDLTSSEDYTTGQRRDRTNFSVALSKRLLSDRLKVTVGSNYELEGPQQANQNASNVIGNVSVDYMLSRDGQYLLRGYRKSDYEAVVEGYIIETGLKFIMNIDYNKLGDIFRKSKPPGEERRNKREQGQQNNETTNTTSNPPQPEETFSYLSNPATIDERKNIAAVKDSTDAY